MSAAFPRAPRVLAGAAALIAAAWFGLLEPQGFLAAGCPASAAALAVSALVLVAFLGALALAPAALQRLMRRFRSPVDYADGGHVVATIVLAVALFFVLGWAGVATATATIETARSPHCVLATSDAGSVDGTSVLRDVTINFAVFVLPVLFYVAYVHGRGPLGALRLLGVKSEGAARAAILGVIAAIAFLAVLAAIETGLARLLPDEALQNPKALDIAKSVTVWGAIALAILSAVGEEVLFRGFLQPRLGILATTAFFALAHFSYASVSEVVAVLLLALVMGVLYRQTGSLWAPIATHFTFNLVNLIAGIYAPTGT